MKEDNLCEIYTNRTFNLNAGLLISALHPKLFKRSEWMNGVEYNGMIDTSSETAIFALCVSLILKNIYSTPAQLTKERNN